VPDSNEGGKADVSQTAQVDLHSLRLRALPAVEEKKKEGIKVFAHFKQLT
jgi:hypothetical protein